MAAPPGSPALPAAVSGLDSLAWHQPASAPRTAAAAQSPRNPPCSPPAPRRPAARAGGGAGGVDGARAAHHAAAREERGGRLVSAPPAVLCDLARHWDACTRSMLLSSARCPALQLPGRLLVPAARRLLRGAHGWAPAAAAQRAQQPGCLRPAPAPPCSEWVDIGRASAVATRLVNYIFTGGWMGRAGERVGGRVGGQTVAGWVSKWVFGQEVGGRGWERAGQPPPPPASPLLPMLACTPSPPAARPCSCPCPGSPAGYPDGKVPRNEEGELACPAAKLQFPCSQPQSTTA